MSRWSNGARSKVVARRDADHGRAPAPSVSGVSRGDVYFKVQSEGKHCFVACGACNKLVSGRMETRDGAVSRGRVHLMQVHRASWELDECPECGAYTPVSERLVRNLVHCHHCGLGNLL